MPRRCLRGDGVGPAAQPDAVPCPPRNRRQGGSVHRNDSAPGGLHPRTGQGKNAPHGRACHGQAGTPTARPDGGSRCFDDQVSSCQTGTADQMRPPWWGLPGSKDADPAIGGPERRATTCGKQRHDSALTLQLLDG